MAKVIHILFIAGVLSACHSSQSHEIGGKAAFTEGKALGTVKNIQINEASGLAAGINNPGLLWTHNDSGDSARIFLLDSLGNDRGTFRLVNIVNRDWEDISSGPGPDPSKNYLYIAETGDNNAIYPLKFIYRLEEPLEQDSRAINQVDTITFRYPDGTRDAETLLVDPLSKDIYVISKREEHVGVYRAPYPQPTHEIVTLEKLGTLPYNNIVGGDISLDGREILLKTYHHVLYWKRENEVNLAEVMRKPAIKLPYVVEPQGEAIAWKKDGSGFYTLSEERDHVDAILYKYDRVIKP